MREEWRLLAQAVAADGMCQYAVMAARGMDLSPFYLRRKPSAKWVVALAGFRRLRATSWLKQRTLPASVRWAHSRPTDVPRQLV